jgi:hypothetical protein
MATTTPNFGWSVPTSSDLVKNGAVAIETLGDSIDASLVDLKGGTTDQVLAKNSNTDMDFKWVSDATGMTNPMTTTGDVIYSSSGSTPARLGIGTAGQVLKVNSGATAPEWATAASGSAMTLISTTTFSNVGAQNIDSVFNSTYTNYTLILTGLYLSTGSSDLRLRLRAAGSDLSAGAYIVSGWKSTNASLTNFTAQTTSWSLGDIGTRDEQSFYVNLFRPNVAKDTTGTWIYNGTNFNNANGTGGQLAYSATTVADGVAIYAAAGNVYGTISIYGWSK